MPQYTLATIAEHIGASIAAEYHQTLIDGVAPLSLANAQQISFFDNKRYRQQLKITKAAAVIITPQEAHHATVPCLLSEQPYVAFAKLTALFAESRKSHKSIHPTAVIGKHCQIDASVNIGAYVVIGDGVSIAENTEIADHCHIADGVMLGADCYLHPKVTIYHACVIGDNVTIHSGAVIGADGFGFANEQGKWVKVHQLGAVTIGNHVDIGANTCIDRGAMEDTLIGNNVIIDNQVQIAHNVEIGDGTAIAGCAGIAGSTKIGRYCLIGGGCNLNGHIDICDKVNIVGATSVYRSIDKPGVYASPVTAMPFRQWLKSNACHHSLPELTRNVQKLYASLQNLPKWVRKLLRIHL